MADDFDYFFNMGQGGGCIPVEITPTQTSHQYQVDGEMNPNPYLGACSRENSQDFLAVETSHRKSNSSHTLATEFDRLHAGGYSNSGHAPYRRHSNYSLSSNRDDDGTVQRLGPVDSASSRHRTGSTYRILVLGGEGVGKTALTHQFLASEDVDEADIQDDGEEKNCRVSVDGKESSLIFMDSDYDKNTYDPSAANAYIVVYSCTDPDSFAEARAVLKNLRHFEKDKAIILCGNKIDLARLRKISTEDGGKLAAHYEAEFIETSTTLNHRIDNLLLGIVSQIRDQLARRAKHKTGVKPKRSAKIRSKTTDLRRSVHGFMDKIVGKSKNDID